MSRRPPISLKDPLPFLTFFFSSLPSLFSSPPATPLLFPGCIPPSSKEAAAGAEEHKQSIASLVSSPAGVPLSTSQGWGHLLFAICSQEVRPPVVISLLPLSRLFLQLPQRSVGRWQGSSSDKVTWGQMLSQPFPPLDTPLPHAPALQQGFPLGRNELSGQQPQVLFSCPEALVSLKQQQQNKEPFENP